MEKCEILELKAYRPPENPQGRRRYLFLQPTIYKWRVIKTEEKDGVRLMELNKQNSTVCKYLINIINSRKSSYEPSIFVR